MLKHTVANSPIAKKNLCTGAVRVRAIWHCVALVYSLLFLSAMVQALELSQQPLFTGQANKPVVMLAMSRDQELSYKAYPDYSNLSGGYLRPQDTTYRNDFEYYGYFNPKWCYDYMANSTAISASYYEPSSLAVNHKCTGKWSGNFLNWATMTRMDILRKVLYGGKRAVDSAASSNSAAMTVLERAYLPKDAHAFAKVYNGSDGAVSDYTPYTDSTITLCNVSTASDTGGYPVIRVAKGSWYNWSHTEIQQCQWRTTTTQLTTLPASRNTSPPLSQRNAELVAKVNVCVPGKDVAGNIYNPSVSSTATAGCFSYETGSYKPVGVLQKKYESINFGLVTGSWSSPGNGGVLRKKAGALAGIPYTGTDTVNEFSVATGVFNRNLKGIIHNLNLFRIAKYSFDATTGDTHYGGTQDWRNPIGEIYAEAIRYLVGKKSASFDADDAGHLSDLTRVATWDDPVPAAAWCINCSIIILSSGPNSFDGDDLTDHYLKTLNADLTRTALNSLVDKIGEYEFGAQTNSFFLGLADNASLSSQCEVASLKLSALRGRCPEFASSKGTYDVAGLAYFARMNDMRPDLTGKQVISTYAVELSEGLPSFTMPVGNGEVSIVPVCTSGNHSSSCSLVGVRVEQIITDINGRPVSGSYLFYWEDQPDGTWDYDMDAVQRLKFCVGAACGTAVNTGQIKVENSLPYWATGNTRMHMSYSIIGIGNDSGVQKNQWVTRGNYDAHNLGYNTQTDAPLAWYNTLDETAPDPLPANTDTNIYLISKTYTASAGSLAASLTSLRTPLFYAAKYGKFKDTNNNNRPDVVSEWDAKDIQGRDQADGFPDNYFMMKNPALLESGIVAIIEGIARENANGAGVATNSTRLDEGTFVYQALFNTIGWHGEIRAYKASAISSADFQSVWTTKGKFTSASNRHLFSFNPQARAPFEFNLSNWGSLSSEQKTALGSSDTIGQNVMRWVTGEDVTGYRTRHMPDGTRNLLGDVVNSTPVFAGGGSEGHEKLPTEYGSASYKAYIDDIKSKRMGVLYASANDGMLHAINANCTMTVVGDCGKELFAYIPSPIYEKLPLLAASGYGTTARHQYLVDGPVVVGDAYIRVPGASSRQWRNLLVGTMGAGARGLFVLDITEPDKFGVDNVLFEITASDMPEIGNVIGRPFIAPVAGGWKLVLGNGYNSTDGRAYLLVIDLEDPLNTTKSRAVPTNSTNNNGLAGPTLYRALLTEAVSRAYAGDHLGNLWRFNLPDSIASARPAFGSSPNYTPLFVAKNTSDQLQPISAAPTLGFKSGTSVGGADAVMVYFGTGSYLNENDVGNTNIQSFYGIADNLVGASAISGRSNLHGKTMTASTTTRDVDDSGRGAQNPNWASHNGWYLDLVAGERVVSKAMLAYDRVIFSTLIPRANTCEFGGTGWLMELVGVGDSSIRSPDELLLPHNGTFLDNFIPGELSRLKNADSTLTGTDTLIYTDIAGNITSTAIDGGGDNSALGRVSWRQLQ